MLKSGYEYGVSHLIDSGEEAANDRWASAEKLARVSSVAAGETGFIQAKYDAYRTLVDSGVLGRDDLIDGTTADGNVLRFDELEDPRRFVDNINSRIINRFDLDPNVISDQYLSNYDDPFAGVRPGGG